MKPLYIGDLKIPIPIIQGGMGIGISLSGLASSVANMGGVGVISTVGIGIIKNNLNYSYKRNNIDAIRAEIKKAKEKTRGVLGVNIMSVITNFSDMVRTSIEEGIDIIFSGAGLPLDLPGYLKKGVKTKLVPIVSSLRAASIISRKWKNNFNYLPDAFVVEGPKAGGHLGFKAEELHFDSNSLENIVLDIKKLTNELDDKYNKKIPVIAAGGIYTGTDMFKIIKLGASAVQLGTRFVATEECDASPIYKNNFVQSGEDDIQIIKSPVGMPGRAIRNKFLQETEEGKKKPNVCKYNCIKSCDSKTTLYCIADALMAAYQGNMDNGFAFSGSNGGRVTSITTVHHIFTELINEYMIAKEEDN